MEKKTLVLNEGQQAGYETFSEFYLDPGKYVLILKGEAGTGKSTLVRYFLKMIPQLDAMALLLCPDYKPLEIKLTATTHQASEALFTAVEGVLPTQSIHSLLGLIVNKDHTTGKTTLDVRGGAEIVRNTLIVVDEASFADQILVSYLFTRTDNCKFILMGDDGQLTPVGSTFMPAFKLKSTEIELTKVERTQDGTLLRLCRGLRKTILGGPWPKIEPDNDELQYIKRENFLGKCLEAFNNPNAWGNTKVLAYTNARVIEINNFLSQQIIGTSDPLEGQRMLVNTAVQSKKASCHTGEEVVLEDVRTAVRYDIDGWDIKLKDKAWLWFLPRSRADYKARLALARSESDYAVSSSMDATCIDLRPSFACTVNKSQGSTFDTVIIDLDDICKKVRSPNQLARALYVAFSRASKRVLMTGDM